MIFICMFSWNKTSNPEPWNKLDPTYQYKVTKPHTRRHRSTNLNVYTSEEDELIICLSPQFVAISTDYKNLKKEGPEFWNWNKEASFTPMSMFNPSVWILTEHTEWF